MLRHRLLSQLDEGLLVWRPWTWKELNGAVLRAEHIADQHTIDVVLCNDGALDLREVEAVSKGRFVELSLVADGLGDVAHRVLGDRCSLRLTHAAFNRILLITISIAASYLIDSTYQINAG